MPKFKINRDCSIVLSSETMVGQIAKIMIDKHGEKTDYLIEDIPLKGFSNHVTKKNAVYIECGYPRRILNALKCNLKNVDVINSKKTDSVLKNLWMYFFPTAAFPEILENLEDLLEGDPVEDDNYALMCYIQDNHSTIDGNIFFDHPVEHNITVAKQFVNM